MRSHTNVGPLTFIVYSNQYKQTINQAEYIYYIENEFEYIIFKLFHSKERSKVKEIFRCESLNQGLIYILCRSKDQFLLDIHGKDNFN